MSVEFIRGPNVYLRETIATDLDNIKDSLADWDWFPLSTDQTKTILKGALIQMRNIERPYKDTSRFFESFTICKNSISMLFSIDPSTSIFRSSWPKEDT